MAIPKFTAAQLQKLQVNDTFIPVPPGNYVVPSLLAVQTHPKYWQPEPLRWKPARWIKTGNSVSSTLDRVKVLDGEELFVPRKGTYLPWSEGPQICPGKKFAQVEFVAVIACLFRHHRVRPLLQGENAESAQMRCLRVCEDSEHVLLLRLRDGDSTRLIWEKRD